MFLRNVNGVIGKHELALLLGVVTLDFWHQTESSTVVDGNAISPSVTFTAAQL